MATKKHKCHANAMYFHYITWTKRQRPTSSDDHCPCLNQNYRTNKWYQCRECECWICGKCFTGQGYVDFKPIQKYHPRRMDAYGKEWPATSNPHLYCYHCINTFESKFEQDKQYAEENSWRIKPESKEKPGDNSFGNCCIDSNSDSEHTE